MFLKKIARFFGAIVIDEDYLENFRGINKKIVEILNYPIIYEELPGLNTIISNFKESSPKSTKYPFRDFLRLNKIVSLSLFHNRLEHLLCPHA